jgi:hypothetical protein
MSPSVIRDDIEAACAVPPKTQASGQLPPGEAVKVAIRAHDIQAYALEPDAPSKITLMGPPENVRAALAYLATQGWARVAPSGARL